MLKDEFIKSKKCKICDKSFNKTNDKSSYRLFLNHIRTNHKKEPLEYYVTYFLNGIRPKCLCGCGLKTKYNKGKFNKYYSDHKNNVKQSEETKLRIKLAREKNNGIDYSLKKIGISKQVIEDYYFDYINLEKSMLRMSEELTIDFRTLKSYWFKLGLIKDKHSFTRTTKMSQKKWFNKIIKPEGVIIKELVEKLPTLKSYINSVGDKKVTLNEILNFLNVKIKKNFLTYFLDEHLNSSEIKKVKFFKSSQIEIDFLNVLRFYFPNSIKHSFELENKIYDYKLGKKILIELDGEYWHSTEEAKKNDNIKNKIALDNNYILFRISDKHVRDIKFINKIKKIYDNIK